MYIIVSRNKGTQDGPQNIIIVIIETPTEGTPDSGKHPYEVTIARVPGPS